MRVFFYVQHLKGIGHVFRARRIAEGLARAGHAVWFVTGGLPVPGFDVIGARVIQLPPIAAASGSFTDLTDADGRPIDDGFKTTRLNALLRAFTDANPDVLITEAYPFGRRAMRFELEPLMAEARARSPRPMVVTSIRDILQASDTPEKTERILSLVERDFDLVLVHGDPTFARLEDSMPEARRIADRVSHTGMVAPDRQQSRPAPATDTLCGFDVVVSAGSGSVGADVLRTAIAAKAFSPLADRRWLAITGPHMPEPDANAVAAAADATGMAVARFAPDLVDVLAHATLSIQQAGYNTVADALVAGCRMVLVPFETGDQTEQRQRAEALARLNRAAIVTEAELTPARMAQAISDAMAQQPAAIPLRLDGADRTAVILAEAFARFR